MSTSFTALDAIADGGQDNVIRIGALAQAGIIKAHWECWANCSLACPFCYRSRNSPLSTEDAKQLLQILALEGVSEIVFAGGDPSLRNDLGRLLSYAHDLRLHTEVQTNAHSCRSDFYRSLDEADLVGLSLDAQTKGEHDAFRGRRHNFVRVLQLAQHLESTGKPFVVRTVVSASNMEHLDGIGEILSSFQSLRRWSLVQFTPVGDGFTNRARYEISDTEFHRISWQVAEGYSGAAEVNIYPNSRKSGVYFLIGPSGDVHGDVDGDPMAIYPSVGNILQSKISDILARLKISPKAHASRYQGLLTPEG